MIILLIIIAIVVIICLSSNSGDLNDLHIKTNNTTNTTPLIKLDEKDPYNICCALACLATSISYYRSDSCCYLYVRTHIDKNESSIFATFDPPVSETGDYRSLYIPEHISHLLTTLSFTSNQRNRFEITYSDRCINPKRAMEEIKKGINMVDGRPYICDLKSYHPGNNPTVTCIDYTAAD